MINNNLNLTASVKEFEIRRLKEDNERLTKFSSETKQNLNQSEESLKNLRNLLDQELLKSKNFKQTIDELSKSNSYLNEQLRSKIDKIQSNENDIKSKNHLLDDNMYKVSQMETEIVFLNGELEKLKSKLNESDLKLVTTTQL